MEPRRHVEIRRDHLAVGMRLTGGDPRRGVDHQQCAPGIHPGIVEGRSRDEAIPLATDRRVGAPLCLEEAFGPDGPDVEVVPERKGRALRGRLLADQLRDALQLSGAALLGHLADG